MRRLLRTCTRLALLVTMAALVPSGSVHPTTSLWSASGSSLENASSPAFSLIWHFQR